MPKLITPVSKKKFFIIFFLLLPLISCNGSSSNTETNNPNGSDTGSGSGTGDGTTGSTPPAFSGFDFTFQKSDYWEYRWDSYTSSWAQGSSSSSAISRGRFRVSLDSPISVSGLQAFPVIITGKTSSNFKPRWSYLAVSEQKILGSTDGTNFSIIFDAQNGFWPGGGFFVDEGTSALNQAQNSTISTVHNVTQYISGTAIKTGLSSSQSTCEYYPGVGNICGDSSYNFSQWEYFKPYVGPYGYYYYNTYSDCGGGFCSGGTWERFVGLVSSSLLGDSVDYVLENEPNDSPSSAQILSNGVAVVGEANPSFPDSSAGWNVTGLGILAGPDIYNNSIIEDVYKITIPSSGTNIPVTINLDFSNISSGATPDYDLYLINSNGTSTIASSISDNTSTKNYTEQISTTLPPGTYIIGVEPFNHCDTEYKLKASW